MLLSFLLACSGEARSAPETACGAEEIVDAAGACVPTACGTSEFGAWEDADVKLHVGENIQAAADALGTGKIALAAGVWHGSIALADVHANLEIAGRCRELVTLDGGGGDGATIKADSPGTITLRDLTITGGTTAGMIVGDGKATLMRVALDANHWRGLLTRGGAQVEFDDVAITNTAAGDDEEEGAGLDIEASSAVEGKDVRLTANWRHGLVIENGSADLTNLTVLGTLAPGVTYNAGGIFLNNGGRLTASHVRIEGSPLSGVTAVGTGTTLALNDCVISGGTTGADGQTGFGVEAWEGANVALENCVIDDNASVGILADGGTLTLRDAVVSNTASPRKGNLYGAGIGLQDGTTAMFERVSVLHSRFSGIGLDGAGTSLDATDLVVSDVQPAPDGLGGSGISVNDHATVHGERVIVEYSHQAGVSLEHNGSVDLRDCTIRHVLTDKTDQNGLGGLVTGGATLSLNQCTVEDVQQIGLGAEGLGSRLSLADVILRSVGPTSLFVQGHGIELNGGGALEADRVTVSDTIGGGIAVDGGSAVLRDVSINNNRADAYGGGAALEVSADSSLVAERLTIRESVGFGLVINGENAVGTIRGGAITLTRTSPVYAASAAAVAQGGAVLDMSDVRIADSQGVGIVATERGEVSCGRCAISRSEFAGAVAIGGVLTLTSTSVIDTAANGSWGGGIGVYAADDDAPSTVVLDGMLVAGNPVAAIWLDGVTTANIIDSVLIGGDGVELRAGLIAHGNALYARSAQPWNGETGIRIRNSIVGPSGGVGVLLDGGSATFSDTLWRGNATDLVQQGCHDDPAPSDISGATVALCPSAEWLTLPLRYDFFLVDPDAASE